MLRSYIMKILAILSFDIFRYSIGNALEKLGHEIIYLENFNEDTLEQAINTFHPDMAFSMGWDIWHVSFHNEGKFPLVKEILQKYNIFHVYFAEEDWLHHQKWSLLYVKTIEPNYVLTRSTTCIRNYLNLGIPATFFNVGCNPAFHKPVPINLNYQCDVALIANGHFGQSEVRHKSISDLIIPLFEQPFHTRIWGKRWENVHLHHNKIIPPEMLHGILPYIETPKVYNSAKISISLQSCNDQLSNRTFDVLSSGGFLLTSDTPAVRINLIPEVNCAVSSSPEETVEKIKYYLTHEDERIRIAKTGRDYAIKNFAYQKTLTEIWPKILAEYRKAMYR